MNPGSAGTLEDVSRFQMLSDSQWDLIAPMLPARTGRQGRPFADARTMLEAIIHRYRCIDPWRDLAEVYGPWQRSVRLAGRGSSRAPLHVLQQKVPGGHGADTKPARMGGRDS